MLLDIHNIQIQTNYPKQPFISLDGHGNGDIGGKLVLVIYQKKLFCSMSSCTMVCGADNIGYQVF